MRKPEVRVPFEAIRTILDYNHDERRDYRGNPDPCHIYLEMIKVLRWLHACGEVEECEIEDMNSTLEEVRKVLDKRIPPAGRFSPGTRQQRVV